MVQFLSIKFFVAFLQFLLGFFQKFPVFVSPCTLFLLEIKPRFLGRPDHSPVTTPTTLPITFQRING